MADDSPPSFLRLFIALAVPPDVRKEIELVQGRLQRCSPPGAVRWTKPEQFHVTLKFLGDVPAGQLPELEKAVSAICAGVPALQLSARGIGFFPGGHKPRVIWAGASDENGGLAELHRQMDDAMRPFAPVDKPGKFTGHITLGRVKPGRSGAIAKLLEQSAAHRDRDFGCWRAGEAELIRCDLTPSGALHTSLMSCRLAGRSFLTETET